MSRSGAGKAALGPAASPELPPENDWDDPAPAPGQLGDQPCPSGLTGYLAAPDYLQPLLEELTRKGARVVATRGGLVLAEGPVLSPAWALNCWLDPVWIPAPSISAAARSLRTLQRNWCLLPGLQHFRRARLIQDKLPHVAARPLVFPQPAPTAPLGSWTLWRPDLLLAAARCSSPFPHGEARFVENRADPPSRAYLKLWEAFTRLGCHPQPGAVCVDLGASPGGWSWVLGTLGAKVISVDKAPLADSVLASGNVTHHTASAFALEPDALGPVDWLFSDVICYPDRLLRLIERWRAARTCRFILCSLKFQGATDHPIADAIEKMGNAKLMHLFHNKHELTCFIEVQ